MGHDIWDEVKDLSAPDKISKSKITLNREQPFFAYLVEHLRIKPDTQGKLPCPTMGVDAKGNCIYSEKFVVALKQEELVGLLAHEVMHVANEHIPRRRERNLIVNGIMLWNICADLVVDQMLLSNGFTLPSLEGHVYPQNNQAEIFDTVVENISEKSVEDIYEELQAQLKQMVQDGRAQEGQPQQGQGQGQGSSDSGDGESEEEGQDSGNQQQNQSRGKNYNTSGKTPSTLDEHMEGGSAGDKAQDSKGDGKETDGNGMPKESQGGNMPDVDWKKIMAEAVNHAKMRGQIPLGAERMFADLHKHKINWRAYLRRVIASKIPFDVTYSRPNKKYQNQDIFMPSVIGESVKVICSIDTSGSISQQDLEDYISEMIGISRSFYHVDFFIMTHDHAVHDYEKIFNGNVQKIKQMKIHGGGGTSHLPVYEFIREKRLHRETKLLVSFTDGYSEYPERRPEVETIFVLSGGHCPAENMPKWGTTVCLD